MKEHEGLWFRDQEEDNCIFLWNIFGSSYEWLLDEKYRNRNDTIKSSSTEYSLWNCLKDNKYKRVGPVEVGKW